jgi:hypothetical protein
MFIQVIASRPDLLKPKLSPLTPSQQIKCPRSEEDQDIG